MKVRVKSLYRIFILLVLSFFIVLNSLYIKSPIIGIPVSLAFFFVASIAVSDVFFWREKRFFRITLGLATFIVLTALFGSILIILAKFSEFWSLVMVGVTALIFGVLSHRMTDVPVQVKDSQSETKEKLGSVGLYFAVGAFVVFVVIGFYALATARTGEGGASVWLTIPYYFLPSFFVTSLLLVIILFFTRANIGLKLSLIFVYSFLARSLFWIVWYPGRYGDPWMHLGRSRFIDGTGMPYSYSKLLQEFLIYDLIKNNAQYAPLVLITRMFNVDIYWVHILFVPFLWSFLVPLFAYKLAEMLAKGRSEKFSLITALVTSLLPSLVIWGTVSVPNSLGFIFFFFVVLLMFYWIRTGKRQILGLSLLVIIATFFAHALPAIFALMFFLFVTFFRKSSRTIVKVIFYLLLFLLYPLALYSFNVQFSLGGLFSLESFGSLLSDIVTVMNFFGLLGLVLCVRSQYVDRRNMLVIFAFYVLIIFEYYLSMYGMSGLPYGAGRVLVMADFLLLPFVALGVIEVVNILVRVFSSFNLNASFWKKVKVGLSPRSMGFTLICLVLSAQASLALYQAYPHEEITDIQPAVYMMEAIYYINSTAPGPYVVLCDTQLTNIATGLLGIDYSYGGSERGLWGQPFFTYPTIKLYGEMVANPSVHVMARGLGIANWTEIAYFVLSVMAGASFERALEETSAILPVDAVFGDGKLYIFKYPLPLIEKPGPPVKVTFDDGVSTKDVETSLTYMVETEINSTLTLSGYTSYNITKYPMNWVFLDLTVNNASVKLDDASVHSSDVNTFIYVKGLDVNDVVKVTWQFNSNYPNVGWKEDSFKTGWHTHERYTGTITPQIGRDGNVLNISHSFAAGESYEYYYYVKSVNVSTDDYDYVVIKWRSTGPIATACVYFEYVGGQTIVELGSQSTSWATTIVKLQRGLVITSIMVGITDLKATDTSGLQTIYVDFILICAKA